MEGIEQTKRALGSFSSELVSEHVVRIRDCANIAAHLVVGERRACLLDTCCGLGDIASCVATVTDLPVTVAISHGHFDHCGGIGTFEDVLMSPLETDLARKETDQAFRSAFLNREEGMSTVPDDFAPAGFSRVKPAADGFVVDLGGVSVEFVQAPGHTPGIFAFFIPEDCAFVIGDICDDNVLLFGESATVSGYLACLDKIDPFIRRADHLWGNHGSFTYSRELIANVRESCELVLAGRDARVPAEIIGISLLSAQPIDDARRRLDGKVGNVLYALEKAC